MILAKLKPILLDICENRISSPIVSQEHAIKLLGTMQGGYSTMALTKLLESNYSMLAANELSNNILIFDNFNDIVSMAKSGNKNAESVLRSWAEQEWFTNLPDVKEKISLTVFKVNGEINTDDLSPAQDAWSRPDIPLHALSMLKVPRDGILPDIPHEIGPMKPINNLKSKNFPIVFVGDVVGTGLVEKVQQIV